MENNVRIAFIPTSKNKHSSAIKLAQSFQTHSIDSKIDHSYTTKLIRVHSLNTSTSPHFLLNSILIAEAIMALLRFSLLLTLFLTAGQSLRQPDEEEPTNVSCSIVFPTSVDLDPLAKSSVSDEVVPDR